MSSVQIVPKLWARWHGLHSQRQQFDTIIRGTTKVVCRSLCTGLGTVGIDCKYWMVLGTETGPMYQLHLQKIGCST